MKVITVSDNCVKLIEYYECQNNVRKYLKAYICPAGVPTIGLGTTVYPNGIPVKLGDEITVEQAYQFCKHDLNYFERIVDRFTRDDLNQGQFDACVDFTYNEGEKNFKNSSLLKAINTNVNDVETITKDFIAYDEARIKGVLKPLAGLKARRYSEAYLYEYGILKFNS